jgi:poly(hydroxyalkanoate) depolymerase family esterase
VRRIRPWRWGALVLVAFCGLAIAPAAALAGDPPDPGSTQSFTYGTGPLSNPYIVYTPTTYNPRRPAPLFVMVHGCQTTAYQQMRANLINQLAEREGFVVLYPDIDESGRLQPSVTQNCWRFPVPNSWQRGQGDAVAIAGMTQAVISRWSIDPQRVYLSGMSAGGFMTSILAAAYPDLYAAVAIAAGGAYGDGSCLFGLPGNFSAEESAQLAFDQEGPRARVVPILVMGGDADQAVVPACADKALEQGLRTDNLVFDGVQTAPINLSAASVRQYQKPGGYSYKISSYADGHGCLIGERVLIHGMNHFWPGGSSDQQWHNWTDPKAPSGAELAWSFVSAFHKDDTAWSCRPAPPQRRHSRPRRHAHTPARRHHRGHHR